MPVDFWERARFELEKLKPVLMLAEDNKVVSLLNYAFDLNYNWNLYETLLAVAKGTKTADKIKYYIPDDFPEGTYTLNFLDNHDKNSYERTIMGGFGKDALPSMFGLVYTIPGIPMVYTGDEIGLDHAIAFMEKDTIDWNSSEVDYRPLLKELAAIRSDNEALYTGNYGGKIEYFDAGKKSVLVFTRKTDSSTITCVFNLVKRESEIDLGDLLEGGTVLLHGQGAEVLDFDDLPASEYPLSGQTSLQPWEFFIVRG